MNSLELELMQLRKELLEKQIETNVLRNDLKLVHKDRRDLIKEQEVAEEERKNYKRQIQYLQHENIALRKKVQTLQSRVAGRNGGIFKTNYH